MAHAHVHAHAHAHLHEADVAAASGGTEHRVGVVGREVVSKEEGVHDETHPTAEIVVVDIARSVYERVPDA